MPQRLNRGPGELELKLVTMGPTSFDDSIDRDGPDAHRANKKARGRIALRASKSPIAAGYWVEAFSGFTSSLFSRRGFFSFFFSSEPRNSRTASSAPSPMRHPTRVIRV